LKIANSDVTKEAQNCTASLSQLTALILTVVFGQVFKYLPVVFVTTLIVDAVSFISCIVL